MSEIYETLEKEVEQIDSIQNWTEKVNKIKELKKCIVNEQEKLNDLVNTILKNEQSYSNKKKKKIDLDYIVNSFKESENIDDKIKYYHLINYYVNQIEKQLFDND
jgi:Zn ribbon nucleic-acid-binding protein